jgi:uncharacterized membrane protein
VLPDLREALLVAVRWFHAASAVALVGGSSFCLLILAPVWRAGEGGELRQAVDRGFKELVDLSLVVFLASGALLTFERLSSGAASTAYVVVLAIKLLLSLLLYRWAFQVRRVQGWNGPAARLLVGSGYLVVLLAAILKTLYESGLRPS